MKVFAITQGDRSVGIFSSEATLGLNIHKSDLDDDYREDVRKLFKSLMEELYDDSNVGVWFEDECASCQSKLTTGKCKNKRCITYQKEVSEDG